MTVEELFWEVIPERTQEHWLEVRDPDGMWSAYVKWDGCIELQQSGDEPFNDENGHYWDVKRNDAADRDMHICDLDDAIARLQALKAAAKAHFGEDWPQ